MPVIYVKDTDGNSIPFEIDGSQPTPEETEWMRPYLQGVTSTAAAATAAEPESNPAWAPVRGAQNIWDQTQSGLASLAGKYAEETDNPELQSYFQQVVEDNDAQLQARAVDAGILGQIGEGIGTSWPGWVGNLGGMTAGAAIGAPFGPVGATIGGIAGAFLGGAVAEAPSLLAQNLERQKQQGGEIDWEKAATATVGQAAVSSVAGMAILKMARILGVPVKALRGTKVGEAAKQMAGKVLANKAVQGGKIVAGGALTEGVEEALQQALERWQADLELTSPEAIDEYLHAAAVGAGAGAFFGAGAAGVRTYSERRKKKKYETLLRDVEAEADTLKKAEASAREDARSAYAPLEEFAGRMDALKETTPAIENQTKLLGTVPSDPDVIYAAGPETTVDEDQYRAAVDAMRAKKKFSPAAIRRSLKVDEKTAQDLFDEMGRRGEAKRVGSAGQYFRINTGTKSKAKDAPSQREFKVDPIENADGRTTYGVYEYVTDEKGNVTTKKVDERINAKLAHAAARRLDPNYAYRTNVNIEAGAAPQDIASQKSQLTEWYNQYLDSDFDSIAKFIDSLIDSEVRRRTEPESAKLQESVDAIIGPGKVDAKIRPEIIDPFDPNALVEGAVSSSPTLGGKPLLEISRALNRPNLSEDAYWQNVDAVTGHELIHAFREADMLNLPEWKSLSKLAASQKVAGKPYTFLEWAAARNPDNLTAQSLEEEAVAEMAKAFRRDPTQFKSTASTRLGKLVERIKEFFRGLQQGRDTLENIFSGQMADREAGSGGLGRSYVSHPFWSKVQVAPFYSNMDRIVERIDMVTAKPSNWISKIKGQDDYAPEEDRFMGLTQWLKDQGDTRIPKEKIGEFIRQNSVQIEETPLGEASTEATGWRRQEYGSISKFDPGARDEGSFGNWDAGTFLFHYKSKNGQEWASSHYNNHGPNLLGHTRYAVTEIAGKKTIFIEELQSDLHQLGAQEGYEGDNPEADQTEAARQARGRRLIAELELLEQQEIHDLNNILREEIFAAVFEKYKIDRSRFSAIYDAQEKVAVIQGRLDVAIAQGKGSTKRARRYTEEILALRDFVTRYKGVMEATTHRRRQIMDDPDYEYAKGYGQIKAPDFPMRNDWAKMLIKRIIRHAAETDIEQIAWHGEEASVVATEGWGGAEGMGGIVDRYLKVTPNFLKNYLKPWGVEPKIVDARSDTVEASDRAKASDRAIALYGGSRQDWANADPWDAAFPEITDLNVAMGMAHADNSLNPDQRDGLTALYQAWLNRPNAKASELAPYINKLKNYDPSAMAVNIEDGLSFPHSNKHLSWTFPVTEQMKEDVLTKGQPMWGNRFKRYSKAQQPTKAFKDWFEDSKVVDDYTGEPEVQFHATHADLGEDFRPVAFDTSRGMGSHFGTMEASQDRLVAATNQRHDYIGKSWLDNNDELRRLRNKIGAIRKRQQELDYVYYAEGREKQSQRYKDNVIEMRSLNDALETIRGKMKRIEEEADQRNMEGANVMPVYLSIQNPFEMQDAGEWHNSRAVLNHLMLDGFKHPDLQPLLDEAGATEDAYRFSELPEDFEEGSARTYEFSAWTESKENQDILDATRKMMKEAGYDGIKYVNEIEDAGSWSWIAFDATQIKSATGNVGDFSRLTGDIRYSRVAPMGQRVTANPSNDRLADIEAQVRMDTITPFFKGLIEKGASVFGIDREATSVESAKKKVDSTFIQLQDRMLPLAQLVDRVRDNGGVISTEKDPFVKATLNNGVIDEGILNNKQKYYEPLHNAVTALNVTTRYFNRLADVNDIADVVLKNYENKKYAVAELYLYAQHAKERNAEMRARNESMRNKRPQQYAAGSGMTDEEADQILNFINSSRMAGELSDLSNPNSIRSRMRALIKQTNNIRVQSGLTPDFSEIDPYSDYVPLRDFLDESLEQDDLARQFNQANGFKIKGKEDPSALGRRSPAAYVMVQAVRQNEEAIVRAANNDVSRSFINLIRQNPEEFENVAKIIERIPMVPYLDRNGTKKVRMRPMNDLLNRRDVLVAKEGGKEIRVMIKDERIRKALIDKPDLFRSQLGPLFKGLLGINRVLAAVRTSYNPEFLISNGLKDLQQALVNLSEFEKQGLQKAIVKDLMNASKGIWVGHRDEVFDEAWAKEYKEFRKYGGMTAFLGIRDIEDTIAEINRMLSAEPAKGFSGKRLEDFKKLWKLLEDANIMVENAARLSSYKHLRDHFLEASGDPTNPTNIKRARTRAAFVARRLTVDFNAGGEQKNALNAAYLFYNASIQGTMALLTPLARSKKVRQVWAGIFAAGVAQDLLNRFFSPEDDDGIKQYDKIPQWVLENNMVMMDPFGISERGYWKLPMPYLLNSVHNMGREISRYMHGATTLGEMTQSITGTFIETINPLGSANTFLNFVSPTVLDPFIDMAVNENFAGAPIAKPSNPFDPADVVASQRYWNNTSPTAISLADLMHKLTGGKGDYWGGAVEVSPEHIEYMFQWLFGGAGATVQRLYEFGAPKALGGKQIPYTAFIEGKEVSVNDIPFVRRFRGNVTSREDFATYIENRERYDRLRRSVEEARGSPEFKTIIAQHRNDYRKALQFRKLENARRRLGKKISKIMESTRSEKEKARIVDTLKEQQQELVSKANALARE